MPLALPVVITLLAVASLVSLALWLDSERICGWEALLGLLCAGALAAAAVAAGELSEQPRHSKAEECHADPG